MTTDTADLTTQTRLLTADDLLRLCSEGVRDELIRGVLCETMPAGIRHGKIAMRLGGRMMYFVDAVRVGTVVGTDSGSGSNVSPISHSFP